MPRGDSAFPTDAAGLAFQFMSASVPKRPTPAFPRNDGMVESPGGISPPGAPRSLRDPLDSHGSRCSAVSMAQLPMSEERRICAAKPIKPVACSFGFETQPVEFAGRPADDIEVNPLQGRTQLRSVEVAVVVDPASNAWVVHLGQIWQGFVTAMMKRPAPDRSANERLRLRAGGGLEAVREDTLRAFPPHRLPGPKLESQKVERDDREVAASVRILAVDDLRLLGMQHQLAGRKAVGKRAP